MNFPEYLKCANKHLKACMHIIDHLDTSDHNSRHVLLELYYLSGYILEAMAVYCAYKENGWNDSLCIMTNWDDTFTSNTRLDYFVAGCRKGTVNGRRTKIYFSLRPLYHVQRHNFQDIVKNVIWRGCYSTGSASTIPYFGINSSLETDIADLIDKWSPNLRYSTYANYPVTEVQIRKLLEICKSISVSIPKYIG